MWNINWESSVVPAWNQTKLSCSKSVVVAGTLDVEYDIFGWEFKVGFSDIVWLIGCLK